MPEILFAAEIAFRCLDRCVPKQELNLLKTTTAIVAQLRAGPPRVSGAEFEVEFRLALEKGFESLLCDRQG
jgi:hypothetical protein